MIKKFISVSLCVAVMLSLFSFSVLAQTVTQPYEITIDTRVSVGNGTLVDDFNGHSGGEYYVFRRGTQGSIEYNITIPEGQEGDYGLYITGKEGSSDHTKKWGLNEASVYSSEGTDPVSVINRYSTYYGNKESKEYRFGKLSFDTPGSYKLKISLYNTSTSGESHLVGIRLVKGNIFDSDGNLELPINKYTEHKLTSLSTFYSIYGDSQFIFHQENNTTYGTNPDHLIITAWTQKSGWYKLYAYAKIYEVTDGVKYFYWDDLTVTNNGNSFEYIKDGSKDYIVNKDGNKTDTFDKYEVKQIWLKEGLNTITLGLFSPRNSNHAGVNHITLSEYEPVNALGEEGGLIELAKEKMTIYNEVEILPCVFRFGRTTELQLKINAAQAGTYPLYVNVNVTQNDPDSTDVNIPPYNRIFKLSVKDDDGRMTKSSEFEASMNNYTVGSNHKLKIGNVNLKEGINTITLSQSGATSHLVLDVKSIEFEQPFVKGISLTSEKAEVQLNANSSEKINLKFLVVTYDNTNAVSGIKLVNYDKDSNSGLSSLSADIPTTGAGEVRTFLLTDDYRPAYKSISSNDTIQ